MSKGQIPHALMDELRSFGYDAEADGTIRYQDDHTNKETSTMTNVRWEALAKELEGHVIVVDDRVIYEDSGSISEVRYTDTDKSGQYDTFMYTTIVNIGCSVEQMQLDRYIENSPIGEYHKIRIDGPTDVFVRRLVVDVSSNNEVHVNKEVNIMPSKGDHAVDVAAKVTAKTIVIAGKSAVVAGKGTSIAVKATHKWVKNTGAPTAIKAGRGISSKLRRYITTVVDEVQTSRQEIKNNNNKEVI